MDAQEAREAQEREQWGEVVSCAPSDLLHMVLEGQPLPSLDGCPRWLAEDELIQRGAT